MLNVKQVAIMVVGIITLAWLASVDVGVYSFTNQVWSADIWQGRVCVSVTWTDTMISAEVIAPE